MPAPTPAGAPNPISVGAGIGGTVGAGIGDLIGWFLSQGDRDSARKLIEQANPSITPENETAILQGRSAFDQIDPRDREAQLTALDQLHNIWSNQGLDPIAQAQIAQARAATEGQANAQNGALMGMAAQRGMADSGATMAAERSNTQAMANTGAMSNMAAAAGGEQRGMDALGQYMGGATALRGQDADKATAQDAISRFNAANSQAVQQRNVDRNMQGQVDTYGNQLGKAGAYNDLGRQTQQSWQQGGQGVGAAAGAAVGFAANPIAAASGV